MIGLGVFALLNALWLAIASGPGGDWVAGHLAWFLGASAMASLLLAGVIAGGLAGIPGALAGMANGITAWGLLFVLSLTAFIPGTVDLTSRIGSGVADGPSAVASARRAGASPSSRRYGRPSGPCWQASCWPLSAASSEAGSAAGQSPLRSTGRCRAAQGPPARRPSRMPVKTR